MSQIRTVQKPPIKKSTKKPAVQKQKGIDYASYGRQGKLTNPFIQIDNKDLNFKPEELTKYVENFKFFDRNGSGYIRREDFGFSIRALGFLVTTIELNEIANFLDTQKTKQYNIEQYLAALNLVKDRKPQQSEILKSLEVFDKKGMKELKEILTTLGDPVSQKEFNAVFGDLNQVDVNLMCNILMNKK